MSVPSRRSDDGQACAAPADLIGTSRAVGHLPWMADSSTEAGLRRLAERLQFKVEQHGDRFTLTRTADVSRPVVEEGLTLSEAEELLERWKLRGLGGG